MKKLAAVAAAVAMCGVTPSAVASVQGDTGHDQGAAAVAANAIGFNGLAWNGVGWNGLAWNGVQVNGIQANGATRGSMNGLPPSEPNRLRALGLKPLLVMN